MNDNWFVSIAIPMTVLGVIILWLIRAAFTMKLNIWYKLAISVLIGVIGNIVIVFLLGKILNNGRFDIWNLMSVIILSAIAAVLLIMGRIRKNR